MKPQPQMKNFCSFPIRSPLTVYSISVVNLNIVYLHVILNGLSTLHLYVIYIIYIVCMCRERGQKGWREKREERCDVTIF